MTDLPPENLLPEDFQPEGLQPEDLRSEEPSEEPRPGEMDSMAGNAADELSVPALEADREDAPPGDSGVIEADGPVALPDERAPTGTNEVVGAPPAEESEQTDQPAEHAHTMAVAFSEESVTAAPGETAGAIDALLVARKETRAQVAAFADLSLWDVLGRGVRAPRQTWRLFWAAIGEQDGFVDAVLHPHVQESVVPPDRLLRGVPAGELELPADAAQVGEAPLFVFSWQVVAPFLLMVAGLLATLIGSSFLTAGVGTRRSEPEHLHVGAPWLLTGLMLWLIAATVRYQDALMDWGTRLHRRVLQGRKPQDAGDATPVEAAPEAAIQVTDSTQRFSLAEWTQAHSTRLTLAGLGLLLSLGAYLFNGDNMFTTFGVFVWIGSILVWLAVLTPPDFDMVAWVEARRAQWQVLFERGVYLRLSWTGIALILFMVAAAYFRLHDLAGVPPQMTSDHVEKLLDAQRILDGTTQIFFPNNGGREGLQMYLVAIFSRLTGLGMQFLTLKWVSVLEGLITIPVLWWMGRELIDDEEPELGNLVGLTLAALVAVSYWHVALSRLSLRIILTPLIMALVMVYLARAMRHNRRTDFLKAGVALGIGLYCYQAVRMIPVLIVLGVLVALVFRARGVVERRRYLVNLGTLVVIAVVIFVPLGRVMIDFPHHFWMRATGRFFGDDVITETDPETGEFHERDATLEDRLNAFSENLPVLSSNIRNALLMFNWKGDVAWINGAPNEPAMDLITGSLLILGLAAWLVRLIRRRDVVDWIILPGIFIMLLPSALSIAFPVENPSATRTSGSLPLVYLIAAYGLAVFLWRFERLFQGAWRRRARGVSVVIAAALVWGAYGYNSALYFDEYAYRYRVASLPYTVAGGVLRDFVQAGGSYGNAFMVAYDYWFDHRAIGIEGGRIGWPNGLFTTDDLPTQIQNNMGTEYAFDPDRPVMFFYHQHDSETAATLRDWFPDGESVLRQTGDELKDFFTYIAPPPGEDWLRAFLDE